MTVAMPATLTRDPRLVKQHDTLICEMRVAELNSGGPPLFIDVAAFGPQAEVCARYLRKGRHVFIDGRLRLEEWKAKDGTTHRDYSIVADRVTFLPGGSRPEEDRATEAEALAEQAPVGEGPDPGRIEIAAD
jgi:single-strand DNA-binding protein